MAKGDKGDCPTCGHKRTRVLEASELEDYFTALSKYYVVAEPGEHYAYDHEEDRAILGDSGDPLYELIGEWNIFSDDAINELPSLLEELFPGYDATSSYTTNDLWYTEPDKAFRYFTEELMHKRRFFQKETLTTDDFDIEATLGGHLNNLVTVTKRVKWYRARRHDRDLGTARPTPFNCKSIGCPPAKRVFRGMRANPAGISYLYLGSDVPTVIAEVRAVPGDYLTIGSFVVPAGLRIIDLTRELDLVDPIHSKDINADLERRALIHEFDTWLSRPVRDEDHEVDYVPTQYLAEYILHKGYDGIKFRSSLAEGKNLVLFDPGKTKCIRVEQRHIKGVTIKYDDEVVIS